MVSQDRLVSLDLTEQVDLLDQMDNLASLVQLDNPDSQARRVTLADQVPPVSLGKSAHAVLQGRQDRLANPDHLANRDLKELQVQLASQDHKVHLDKLDSEVQLEQPAAQVYTPLPLTVKCFLTVHVCFDICHIHCYCTN